MKKLLSPVNILAFILILSLTFTGVVAVWLYGGSPAALDENLGSTLGNFKYGLIYITKISVTSGDYLKADISKTDDTKILADLELSANENSTAEVQITFYNSTAVSYYYDKAETLSSDNGNIVYTVSEIAHGDEVPSNTYKTITVTFEYASQSVSASALLSDINFKFTVDRDSVTDVVAESAVGRFKDILNNLAFENSYETLTATMDSRGSSYNKGSAVTYIGNVVGAGDTDSNTINQLFTSEFMNEDLDGDGTEEPITIMIKRYNWDENAVTGDDYTYKSGIFGRETTVQGAEMTLYITAEQIGSGSIVVYAVTFTKLEGASEWTELVPLTKGTATTNNYSNGAYGDKNSFNTDTWVSDSGLTMKDLALAASK